MDTSWVPPRLRTPLGRLLAAAQADPAVLAAWVGGSLARGTADDWSDIDLHLLVTDGFEERLVAWFSTAMNVVLADTIPGVPGAHLVVTDEWIHADVVLHDADGFGQDEARPARVLHNPDGLVRSVDLGPDEMRGEPYLPAGKPELFCYFLGLAVSQARREEWLALSFNAARLRDALLVPLMLAENGIRKADGANRLNRYLTSDQVAVLDALPAIGTDPEGLLAAHVAIAHEYLACGRRLADRLQAPWPGALQDATTALWRTELGRELAA